MVSLRYKLACLTLLSGFAFPSNGYSATFGKEFPVNTVGSISQTNTAAALSRILKLKQSGSPNYTLDLSKDIPLSSETVRVADPTYTGPWVNEEGLSANAKELINSIQDVRIHGLNPESYDLTALLDSIEEIFKLSQSDTEASVELKKLRSNLDKQFGESFYKLARDLGRGAVRAKKVQRQMFRDAPTVKPHDWIERIANGEVTTYEALRTLMPQEAGYQRLTLRMRDLLTERAAGGERIQVAHSESEASSNKADDIHKITLRLIEVGELPIDTALTGSWDESLQFALEAFQQRQGIKVSGKIDERTRKALNITLEQEIEAVALSLERWRWMPRDLGEKHVFVNLPDYSVQVRKNGNTLLSMATVVGKARHATPTFSEDLQYIVFNPTWTVPKSITNRELIPKERKNPGYLKARNFDIMRRDGDHLVKVSYADVTDADYAAKRFPYVLQQRSGNDNALGRMKFMMPNPYNIYLHDTQAKKLFQHHDRAYSHGCIRLSDPDSMARVLLEEDGFTAEEIENHLANKDRKLVRFKTPIPTHLTYMTTWVDEYGALNRRADIYNHDEALLKALKAKNTLISVLDKLPAMSRAAGEPSYES